MPTCVRCALYYSDVSEYRVHWHTVHEVVPPEEDSEGEEGEEEEEENSEEEEEGADPSLLPPDMLQTWLHAGAGTPKAIVHCTDSGEVYSLYRCLLQALMQGDGGGGGGLGGLDSPTTAQIKSRLAAAKSRFDALKTMGSQ